MYGIWARVSGGITGTRAAWCKSNGTLMLFDTYEEAKAVADRYNGEKKYSTANFSYTAMEYEGDLTMARIKVNHYCNVVTEEHSDAYRSGLNPHPSPQITVPGYRMRLYIKEAMDLAAALLQAVKIAKAEDLKREELNATKDGQ